MNKIIGAFFVVMIGAALAFGQTSAVQERDKDDFEKMTFEVELNKNSYLLFEPIFLRFKFSNQTEVSQTTYNPSFLHDSSLKVSFNGKTSIFEQLALTGGPGVRIPGTVLPKGISTAEEMFNPPFAGMFFPAPGSYQVQFVLHDWGKSKTIESNIINITVEKPTGINKNAFEFMNTYKDFFGLSSWTDSGERGLLLLETFVDKYSRSVYGELAISSLGYMYLHKGELDKATVEFEKLKNSGHKMIVENVKLALADIEKRKKAEQEKSKLSNKPN